MKAVERGAFRGPELVNKCLFPNTEALGRKVQR